MSTRSVPLAVSLALALALTSGCGVEPAPVIDDQGEQDDQQAITRSLVASVDLGGGAYARFFEPSLGTLTLSVLVDSPDKLDVVRALDRQRATMPEVYTALSGQPAPPALVQAQRRLDIALAAVQSQPSRPGQPTAEEQTQPQSLHAPPDGVSRRSYALSANTTWFKNTCCPPGWNYLYCHLFLMGTHSITRHGATWIRTYAYPYEGGALHKLYTDPWWGPKRLINFQGVPEGWYSWLSAGSVDITFIAKVVNADSTKYHLSAFGNN